MITSAVTSTLPLTLERHSLAKSTRWFSLTPGWITNWPKESAPKPAGPNVRMPFLLPGRPSRSSGTHSVSPCGREQ